MIFYFVQYCLLPEIGGVGFVLCDRVILNDLLTNVKRFFVKNLHQVSRRCHRYQKNSRTPVFRLFIRLKTRTLFLSFSLIFLIGILRAVDLVHQEIPHLFFLVRENIRLLSGISFLFFFHGGLDQLAQKAVFFHSSCPFPEIPLLPAIDRLTDGQEVRII